MHLRLSILVAIALGSGRPAVGEQAFPYKAYIAAEDTYVRSGPAETYYPTCKLKAGTQVEVYRHDPGGWYAIKPPEGSFSWIGSRYVRPVQDGLAEITGEHVAVRVGTQLTDRRDVVQVRVKRGEIVELLSPRPAASGRSDDRWCKIAPPSGEFRWVYGSDVDLSPPRSSGGKTREVSPLAEASQSPKSIELKAPEQASLSRWMPATSAPPSSSSDSATTATSATAATPVAGQEMSRRAANSPSQPRTSEDFQKQLDEINIELSLILAQDPTAWNCQELSRRAQTLMDQAQTAIERGHARMLVNRITQCEDLKRRSVAINTAATEVERRSRTASERGGATGLANVAVGSDGRFDGTGRLARVQQSKLGAPRYALLDDQGNVKMYVSPAPGVAMQAYVGHQVGISGVRGFASEQNAEHLTAKHITTLEARLR